MIQQSYSWWFVNVFDPFGRFVIFDHLVLCLVITAVSITVLLGCFYKEDPHSWEPWAERWGYPLAILICGTFFVPPATVIFVLLLPGIAMFAVPISGLMWLYRALQKARERHLLEEIWRLTTQKKGDYE